MLGVGNHEQDHMNGESSLIHYFRYYAPFSRVCNTECSKASAIALLEFHSRLGSKQILLNFHVFTPRSPKWSIKTTQLPSRLVQRTHRFWRWMRTSNVKTLSHAWEWTRSLVVSVVYQTLLYPAGLPSTKSFSLALCCILIWLNYCIEKSFVPIEYFNKNKEQHFCNPLQFDKNKDVIISKIDKQGVS